MRELGPDYEWSDSLDEIDWSELSELYRLAPLGDKSPQDLETVFTNSMFKTFAHRDDQLIGAGRALADGIDCAYIADVAVHPELQGQGIGKAIVSRLVSLASGHKKVLLYANPGRESFYASLGFLPMTTAMAIWADTPEAIANGLLAPLEQ
jgi:predicted GNAT family acetyltransferase